MIVTANGQTLCNSDILFENNNHEEADTLIIHHAVLVKERNAIDAKLMVFSPDTDVLVLLIGNYSLLPCNTSISMVSGIIDISDIWAQLGERKANALPALHAFSGADTTGRFSRVGKVKWFKLYLCLEDNVVDALQTLLDSDAIADQSMDRLAEFVCRAYAPKGINITCIPELRWYLFCKTMAESEKLPSNISVHSDNMLAGFTCNPEYGVKQLLQSMCTPIQIGHGYYQDNDGNIHPHTSDVAPAPTAVVEMVRCQCKTNCATQRCSCKRNYLSCTDLCQCSTDCENDEDTHLENSLQSDMDSDSDE